MSRIAAAFDSLRRHSRRALVPFVMGGDPTLTATEVFLERCAAAGADLLEIGVPFSDPIADGPINQRAAQRALEAGATLDGILDVVARARSRVDRPVVLLSYCNPILAMGLEAFAERAAVAGVDGVVIPDLPPEEGAAFAAVFGPAGIDHIFLAAPTSTDERLAQVGRAGRGFVYCVSLTGVTGVRSALAADVGALVARLRRHTALPVCVGFGISTPDHAREVAAAADGVIVGSAIVALIERDGQGAGPAVEAFVRALRSAVDTGGDLRAEPAS